MSMASGAKTTIMIGFQSAFGVVATEGFILPVNSISLKPERAKGKGATIRGNINPAEPFDEELNISGQVVVPLDSECLFFWLKALLGDPTTTGAGPYTHVYKLGNDRPFFTLEEHFGDLGSANKYYRFTSVRTTSFSFGVGEKGERVVTIGLAAADYSWELASFDASPTIVSIRRLNNRNFSDFKQGGASLASALKWDLSVDFDVDVDSDRPLILQGKLGGMVDGVASVTGNATFQFKDTSHLELAEASTETSVENIMEKSASARLEALCPEVQYHLTGPEVSGPKGQQLPMTYEAYYEDAAEATALQITLTNTYANA